MTTVIGVAAGILILGEAPTPILFVGAALTLSGIAVILWRNREKADAAARAKVTEVS